MGGDVRETGEQSAEPSSVAVLRGILGSSSGSGDHQSDSAGKDTDGLLRLLLASLKVKAPSASVEHPQGLIYPLTVASKSQSEARRGAALSVLAQIRTRCDTLVEQAALVSEELIRTCDPPLTSRDQALLLLFPASLC